MRSVRFLTEKDEGMQYIIEPGCLVCHSICFENGEPVAIDSSGIVLKIGKRRFFKLIIDNIPDLPAFIVQACDGRWRVTHVEEIRNLN